MLENPLRRFGHSGTAFGMETARHDLHCLWGRFRGKSITLFFIRRLDTSDRSETLDHVESVQISYVAPSYLNRYDDNYIQEFSDVARSVYV